MIITVVGEKKAVAEPLSVAELIEREKIENPEHVTVSLNDNFVSREFYGETRLSDGDTIEFLYFMGGGSDWKQAVAG